MSQAAVIYDGECPFCVKQADRIHRLDKKNLFSYCPRQSEGLLERFPSLKPHEEADGLRFVDDAGQAYIGADAVYQIGKRLKGPHLVAWIYRIPLIHQCCRGLYALIAKNRKRLSKKACPDGVCEIPYHLRESKS